MLVPVGFLWVFLFGIFVLFCFVFFSEKRELTFSSRDSLQTKLVI